MQLEPRDIGILIRSEAERLAGIAANNRLRDDLAEMKRAAAKLNLLIEALEAVATKR